MTFDDRVRALAPLGLTERQTRFVVTVALHGGYCVRRQYASFAGVQYGKNVRDFLDRLVAMGVATRFAGRADRGHVYHLSAPSVYRAIEQADNRNRRHVGAPLIARRLMQLDAVLAEPLADWYATERDKVALFVDRFAAPEAALPRRMDGGGPDGGRSTRRYFLHKLPIYLPPDSATPHFVYLAMEFGTQAFEHFLRDHRALFQHLANWTVVCLRPRHLGPLAGCQESFDAFLSDRPQPASDTVSRRMSRYFSLRRAVERDELAGLSASDLHAFRTARLRFATPAIEARYAAWAADIAPSVDPTVDATRRLQGELVLRELPHPYEQFGTLAGVA